MQIDQKTLATILQLGGQYMLPIAALLRALYSGVRGRLPDGFRQIIGAALLAGVTAGVGNQTVDIRAIVADVLGNTVFTAGLLSFIVVYLLRMENRGLWVDGILGAFIGLVIYLFTTLYLQWPWPWWYLIFIIPACAAGFIALRFALRQIIRVLKIATYFLVIGGIFVLGAGGFLLYQAITHGG